MNKLLAIAALLISSNTYASNWLNILGQADVRSGLHNPILIDVDLSSFSRAGDTVNFWVKWRYETQQNTVAYNANIGGMQAIVYNETTTRIEASCTKQDFHIYTQVMKFDGQVVQTVQLGDNMRAFAEPDSVMAYTIQQVCSFPRIFEPTH